MTQAGKGRHKRLANDFGKVWQKFMMAGCVYGLEYNGFMCILISTELYSKS